MTDEDSIRDLQRKWFHATMNGDVAYIDDLMTDDIVFLAPGRAPFGRQEFIESFKAMKEQVALKCDGESCRRKTGIRCIDEYARPYGANPAVNTIEAILKIGPCGEKTCNACCPV